MSAVEEPRPNVVGVATSGIQDVSALLPLLGTDQCERLVTSALPNGLLYSAATPMSIFGSLGIVKAGVVVLWGSFDSRFFPGPKFLTDAGFAPSGLGKLLVPVKKDNRQLYVAEDKIRRHLSKIGIQSVQVNLFSSDLWWWNLRLVGTTIFLSGLGLLPYVYLIERPASDAPFRTTWLYPLMRILGCDMAAIAIQFIFQIRTLEEVYYRLCFLAADGHMKNKGESIPHYWDPNKRSKNVLSRLQSQNPTIAPFLEERGKLASFRVPADNIGEENGGGGTTSFFRLYLNLYFTTLLLWAARFALLFGLGLSVVGYIGCFSVVQANPRNSPKGPLVWLVCEAALAILRTLSWAWNPGWDDALSPIVLEKAPRPDDASDAGDAGQQKNSYGVGWTLESLTANNVHALIVGIDEFAGPQGDEKVEGSGFADLTKSVANAQNVANYLQRTLLVPRDQIVVLKNAEATKPKILDELVALSRRVEDGAPTIIYFSTHSTTDDTADEVYLIPYPEGSGAGMSTPEGLKKYAIGYSKIGELLQLIEEKTDNITLILECPDAAAMGQNPKFESRRPSISKSGYVGNVAHAMTNSVIVGHVKQSLTFAVPKDEGTKPPVNRRPSMSSQYAVSIAASTYANTPGMVGHSSHILLAGQGQSEGWFTEKLLEVLTSPNNSGHLPTMTYKGLVKLMNSDGRKQPQRGQWSMLQSWLQSGALTASTDPEAHVHPSQEAREFNAFCTTLYQNRLLFNGLFSRKLIDNSSSPVITVVYSDL